MTVHLPSHAPSGMTTEAAHGGEVRQQLVLKKQLVETVQVLYLEFKCFKTAIITRLKELKKIKELKIGMIKMSHKIENINEGLEIIFYKRTR